LAAADGANNTSRAAVSRHVPANFSVEDIFILLF
jgi:hypothetical protein